MDSVQPGESGGLASRKGVFHQPEFQSQDGLGSHNNANVNGRNNKEAALSPASLHAAASLSDHLSHLSLAAAVPSSLPTTAISYASSTALLSPPDDDKVAAANSVTSNNRLPAPRRTPSSSSLREDRQRSAPSLQKRSSVASLRSLQNGANSTSPHPSLSRRSSTNHLGSSPTGAAMAPKLSSPPPPTAASVAAAYFQREMDSHQAGDLHSQTLVILHDACYGHRFSRPRTSKAALNSIVERPERILASVLGVSAAYVRLARRHAGGGRYAPHPDLDVRRLPVPPFQIRRTSRSLNISAPAVTNVHGSRWMDDLKTMCDAAESRLALNGRELARPRSADKDDTGATLPLLHEGDLYLCAESLGAFEGALGGVCEGVDAVFGPGATKRAFVCIRPPGHHCSASYPSGFCWINNVHVGISYAAMTHGLTHAAILDFDLHHGDGSQQITWEQNSRAMAAAKNAANHKKTMIGYFSLHDINSYPCEMGDPGKVRDASVCIDKAHGQSVWNVHLESWKTPERFWELYHDRYSVLLDKARAFLRMHTARLSLVPSGPPPRAAIFLSAGFDASEWEGAGMQRHKVNVPTDFYAKFTADAVRLAEEEGLGVGGRVISVLEGGYSDRALTSGVLSHLAGLADMRAASSVSASTEPHHPQSNRLATEMTGRLGLSGVSESHEPERDLHPMHGNFDTEWWSPTLLEELEALVYPPPAPATKAQKTGPSYFATTQSFTAKVVVSPVRDRKSFGSPEGGADSPPPIPPVNWAVATHELCKLLIPSDRQTTSCRPEELNAEATRLRRERQTAVTTASATAPVPAPSVTPAENRMQLRGRKPKSSLPSTPKAETPKKLASRGKRRTTIDAVSDILDDSYLDPSPVRQVGRRKSTTSTPTPDLNPDDWESKGGAAESQSDALENTGLGISRPGTTASSRSATVSGGTRKVSSSRGGTPKRSASPKKVPPVPKIPPLSALAKEGSLSKISAANASEGVPPGAQPPPHRSAASLAGGQQHSQDLDGLVTEVKKLSIKLKVPSVEENDNRERKAMEEQKVAPPAVKTPRSPKKSSAAKTARTLGPKSTVQRPPSSASSVKPTQVSRSHVPQPALSAVAASGQIRHEGDQQENLANIRYNAFRAEGSVFPHSDAAELPVALTDHHHHHLQQQQQQPSQLISTTDSASSIQTGKHHHELPIFTPSSPIPFARQQVSKSKNHSG